MLQTVLVYAALIVALVFLAKKFFFKKRNGSGCDSDCGCS